MPSVHAMAVRCRYSRFLVISPSGGSRWRSALCALWEAKQSGQGQVIDVAMTDGVASIASVFCGMQASGHHQPERSSNLFDGGAHFYYVYECADGRYLSVAPIEPHFYAQFIDHVGLAGADLPDQYHRARWPELRNLTANVIRTRSRDDWAELFAPADCCVAPVLTFNEARSYGHHLDRGTFLGGSNTQAGSELAVIPRLSRTPGDAGGASPAWPGADTDAVLGAAGWNAEEISSLRARGIDAG